MTPDLHFRPAAVRAKILRARIQLTERIAQGGGSLAAKASAEVEVLKATLAMLESAD